MSSEEFDKYKRDTQLGFKNNEFPVLVATKAFGMGIDKPNIRYTIHFGIPQSLEAYYQEAGRAGRDREDAVCTIIFSDDDRSLIQKYFDPNVDADKLADIQDPGWNDRGDICRMMHFHKNSFRGANTEKREIKELLSSYIGKHLSSMKTGERKTVEIPYSWSNEDRGNKEKSIYRLSSIGLVEDYTIDYNRKQFVVEICRKTDDGYIKALQEYVGRYKTEEYVENVPYEVASEEGNGIIEKAVCFLIRFVYDEIERKRRRALQNIAEVARSSANGEDIRRALLDYLESSPFTGPLQEILRKVDSSTVVGRS
jgi:ATP-dependent DNA helicase RecQ